MKCFDSVDNNELAGWVMLIPSDFGGRKVALRSGYRGRFLWHISDEESADWLAESYFENDVLSPGESALIKIKLAGKILELGREHGMPVGAQFALREGARIVAVGVITESTF